MLIVIDYQLDKNKRFYLLKFLYDTNFIKQKE